MIDKKQQKQLRAHYEEALARTEPDEDLFGPLATDHRDFDVDPDDLIDEPRTPGLTQPESQVLEDERIAALREVLDRLAVINKPKGGVAIFRRLHGLDDHLPQNPEELSAEIGMSANRIRLIHAAVYKDLRTQIIRKYAYFDNDSRTPVARWHL